MLKFKKFLALVLAIACTLSLFAGCATETAESGTKLDSNGITIIEEPNKPAFEEKAEEPESSAEAEEKPEEDEPAPEENEEKPEEKEETEKENSPSHEVVEVTGTSVNRQPQNNNEESDIKDDEGNFTVPFDIAYPEAFAAGEFKYEEGHALLKLAKGTEGVSKDLRKCGFIGLEKFVSTEEGDWYKAKISSVTDVVTAVNKARELEAVIMADYDYISETEAVDIAATENGLMDHVMQNVQVTNQWYLTAGQIQRSWRYLAANGSQAGGSSSVVVAVIDTGVDYNHPDLAANMWVNTGEIPDNGIDDDNNGYIDDIHGVDTIAGSGDPMDDHAHGTHVAGIIAASNNKEGVVGVAYNAKIMAVKAGQATGIFNQSDIAEAILYAYDMGADVINMSFGGTACSIAVQDALQTAYTRATLVASAGNDGVPNEKTDNYDDGEYWPNYPAALPYVIGVMSVGAGGVESGFTNWDVSAYNGVEYELYAPGEAMLSTLPGGKYGKLSGTSMAAPMVSGAAALLRSYYTDRDMYPSKFIAAQLSSTSEDPATCIDPKNHAVDDKAHNLPMELDVYEALTKLPKPDVSLHNYYIFDSEEIAAGNSGDGVVDAGETINIGAVLRNRWGMSKDTVITIDALSSGGMANPYVEIINGSVNFDSVGTYSTKDELIRGENNIITGTGKPLTVKIAEDCPNDYRIVLNVTITYKNGLDENDSVIYNNEDDKATVEFWVRNGKVLPSQINEDTTLTKNNTYIVANGVYIAEGVTVTVEAGTKIQFWTDDPKDPYADSYISNINVAGTLICDGTLEEPIEMYPCDSMSNYAVEIIKTTTGYTELNYVEVTNPSLHVDRVNYCTFTYSGTVTHYLATRKMTGGSVKKSSIDGKVGSGYIGNSIFYKVGCTYPLEIENIYKDSSGRKPSFIDSCIFVESIITASSSDSGFNSFENCVFLKNSRAITSSNDVRVSEMTFEPYYVFQQSGIGDIVKNTDTGTCYVEISVSGSFHEGYHQAAREIAKMFGGNVCKIETVEEAAFLAESGLNYVRVDLPVGSKTWSDGTPVADFFSHYINHTTINEKYCCFIYNSSASDSEKYILRGNEGYSNGTLIEIPETDENRDFEWTAENIYASYSDFKARGLHNLLFNGNAVLNNLNDTDTSHWMKIAANSYSEYDVVKTMGLGGNYWGTTDFEMIERQIYDFNDNSSIPDLIIGEYLTEAPENTFPFVVDAYLENDKGERVTTVSNETVYFVVKFNRDMDTSVPLKVRFGSSEPYADYEIKGSFVENDPKTWRGIYTLNTTIENGIQYFNISNGRAADDHFMTLYDTPGRFMFEIDTSAAQALIMSGTATETGIQLTWTQDDFETLVGYNVYRSDSEDGFYQRLNDTVIPYDTKEFFDDTVEPGKIYYYNFTVVKTDLTESEPSGKTMLRSMDTMAPNIYHSPVRTAYTGSNLIVGATITDNLQIESATIYYRTVGESEWRSTAMTNHNSRYTGIIGAENLSTAGLEYYLAAFDGVSYTYKGSAEEPFTVTVKLAIDSSSKGDVDGNGVVELKDALMVLQAANDRLNLTEEEFLRADLDENKILSAAEALRILMYANGSITTLQG